MVDTFLLAILGGVALLMGFTLWNALRKQSFQSKQGFEIARAQHPFWYWFNVCVTGFAFLALLVALIIVGLLY